MGQGQNNLKLSNAANARPKFIEIEQTMRHLTTNPLAGNCQGATLWL